MEGAFNQVAFHWDMLENERSWVQSVHEPLKII